MLLVLEIKNITRFIKTRFHCKRGCINMRKHAETSHANKGYKLAIAVFIPICRFHNRHLWYLLKMFFARKRSLAHPYFFSENESL